MTIDSLDALSLRDLRALVAVAEELHFGRAAERLGISQPSLSASIAKSEAVLGRPLFRRTSRRCEWSPRAGEVIEAARSALRAFEILNEEEKGSRLMIGRFRLGIIPTLAPYYLPEILPALRRRFPRLELVLFEATTERVLKLLRRDEIDGAILSPPVDAGDLHLESLFREELILAAPAEEPWTTRRLADVRELDSSEMLFLEDGHCLRDQTLELCRGESRAAKPLHVASLETLLLMVGVGMGAAVVPAMAAARKKNLPGVVYLPFDDPAPSRNVALISRSPLPDLVEVLSDSIPPNRQWRR